MFVFNLSPDRHANAIVAGPVITFLGPEVALEGGHTVDERLVGPEFVGPDFDELGYFSEEVFGDGVVSSVDCAVFERGSGDPCFFSLEVVEGTGGGHEFLGECFGEVSASFDDECFEGCKDRGDVVGDDFTCLRGEVVSLAGRGALPF